MVESKHKENQTGPDDTLIVNTTVWTGNLPAPQKGWLAIRAGRIRAVGTENMSVPPARQIIDGKDKVVLPSFVDCHSHISAAALANISKNGSAFRNKQDALNAIEQAASVDSSSEWLVFFYVDWDSWEDPRPPTAQELEMVSGGRNILLVCESLHRGILSESGLKACNISQYSQNRFIETRRGITNGIVWEEVFSDCLQLVLQSIINGLGEMGVKEVIIAEAQRHLAYGITDAHDPSVNFTISKVMKEVNKKSPLRISWSESGNKGPICSAKSDGSKIDSFGEGPSSAKIFTDGAHRCAMCITPVTAFSMAIKTFAESLKSFSLSPIKRMLADEVAFSNGKIYRKGALFTQQELTKHLQSLSDTHERLRIHALGNHAVDMTCDCIVESGLITKACIEHATIIDDQNLEKLSKHQIQVSLQPGFLPHYGDIFMKSYLGKKYRGLASRSMLDAGVELNMSSDNPCGPLDPLHNIRCAVDRSLPDGRMYLENEAVTEQEAVYAYTIAGTKGINGKAKQGIEVGASADFIILSGDPFLPKSVVESTWINGKVVFKKQ